MVSDMMQNRLELLAMIDKEMVAAEQEGDMERYAELAARVGHVVASMDLNALAGLIEADELGSKEVG